MKVKPGTARDDMLRKLHQLGSRSGLYRSKGWQTRLYFLSGSIDLQ